MPRTARMTKQKTNQPHSSDDRYDAAIKKPIKVVLNVHRATISIEGESLRLVQVRRALVE